MMAIAVITMITLKKKAFELKVILIISTDNATHLIEVLDIAIFKPLNPVLKRCVSGFMLENSITTITGKYAMTVGSKFWREVIQSKN